MFRPPLVTVGATWSCLRGFRISISADFRQQSKWKKDVVEMSIMNNLALRSNDFLTC